LIETEQKMTKPTPPHMRLLLGNPSKRPPKTPRVFPALDDLRPPRGMTPGGRRAWRGLIPQLQRAGLCFSLDAIAARMLCENIALCAALAKVVAKEPTTTTEAGTTKTSGSAITLARVQAQTLRLFAEFGLTPRARSMLDVRPPLLPTSAVREPATAGSKYFGDDTKEKR
jgi:P27 family predicted phage terminase small subunit